MKNTNDFQSHPVFYEEPGQSQLEGFIDFHTHEETQVFVLTDQNTRKHCLPILRDKWGQRSEFNIIEMQAGEAHKNIQTCELVWQHLTSNLANRQALLINLGGGVVCDLGGFASSVYKRGMRFIHFPTTLLAMTDAAIGGKTGVDLGMLKNMIGTFSQPMAVFIDPSFLHTLPERELKNGFAEMLKHGLIAEESYFEELADIGPFQINSEHIRLSVEIKLAIVIRDPFEKYYRKSLNFGHTIGHALESFSLQNSPHPILHGEAVILGMMCETLISEKMKLMTDPVAEKIILALQPYIPEFIISEDVIEGILPLLLHDKKNKGMQPGFSLLRYPGSPLVDQYCQPEMIREALQQTAFIVKDSLEN